MPPDDLTVYPTWDLTLPLLPARSALYPLAPLGVGTPDVESMTSYLARLAAAHSVSPLLPAELFADESATISAEH